MYVDLYNFTYVYILTRMIRFQLHPPAGPPESCESAEANVLIQGTQVSPNGIQKLDPASDGMCRVALSTCLDTAERYRPRFRECPSKRAAHIPSQASACSDLMITRHPMITRHGLA